MNPMLWLVASSIGAALLVVLAVVYRRASAAREEELADELLDEQIRAVAQASGSPASEPGTSA